MSQSSVIPQGRDAELIRVTVKKSISKCKLSRLQIAEKMTSVLGAPVSLRQINGFTATSQDEYRFPLQYVAPFCEVTGDWSLLTVIAEIAGFQLIAKEQQRLIAIGQAFVDRASAQKLLREASK